MRWKAKLPKQASLTNLERIVKNFLSAFVLKRLNGFLNLKVRRLVLTVYKL
jgi:hypothetical protein